MNIEKKIEDKIDLPLNRMILDLVTLGDMSIIQYIRKMADEIETNGHTLKSPMYVSLNNKITSSITQALSEERKRVVGLIEEIRGMEGVSNQALDYLQDRIEKDILSSLDSNPK